MTAYFDTLWSTIPAYLQIAVNFASVPLLIVTIAVLATRKRRSA